MRTKIGFFGKLAFVAIILFLIISIVDKNLQINDLKEKEEKINNQVQAYTLYVEKLNSQLQEEVTEETIKRVAREKLNLRDPGELIYSNDLPN